MSKKAKKGGGPVRYHQGKFPPKKLDWSRLIPLIGPANAALARYDGLLSAIPNAAVLLSPMTTQEAVLSSRIEGTQASMGEVLEYEAGASPRELAPEKEADIHEVLNYRRALRTAESQLEDLPVCGRMIRQAHEILLAGVRGEDKARGRYRTIQNYIGRVGRPIEEARFVPVEAELVEEAMSRWERFLHSDHPDELVALALAHAEFEAIHPFLDGNGRMGRLIIPLFLCEKKLLHKPMFYVSGYLEARREEYFDRLLDVSRNDDWTGWCEFFLIALTEQASTNDQKTREILDLYQSHKELMVKLTRSQHAIAALDFLFDQPIFDSKVFISQTGINASTARRILRSLVDGNVLHELRPAGGRQSAAYAFPRLLNIAEGTSISLTRMDARRTDLTGTKHDS